MWYLITFEAYDFVKVTTEQEDASYEIEGREDNKPIILISEGNKNYRIEILDEYHEGYRLTEINKLNPNHCILLNHATVLLKWENGIEILETILKKILDRKDKYVIIPVSEVSSSNFLPLEFLNPLLRK